MPAGFPCAPRRVAGPSRARPVAGSDWKTVSAVAFSISVDERAPGVAASGDLASPYAADLAAALGDDDWCGARLMTASRGSSRSYEGR